MKKQLLELLICPLCLPSEILLTSNITEEANGDIETGELACPACGKFYPIVEGIANLDPYHSDGGAEENKYETDTAVASYLWSQFSDLSSEEMSSQAYSVWAELITPHKGIALDAGGAVGRFTFEMSAKSDFAIGFDNSLAFIRAARLLMKNRHMTVAIKDEGYRTKDFSINLPDAYDSSKTEFIVANALALPFREGVVGSFSSLNLVDKVPFPMQHLIEMNRVTRHQDAQFLLSDPFSWSEEAAEVGEWLGGQPVGQYTGRGINNIKRILEGGSGPLQPIWSVSQPGSVWWKIRTHTNHYELIKSCFVHAQR